ncbi:hypothetical protein EVJ58_g3404 [Rhodofomes roseus]|uniref:Uncharacterized protein n=1 Tax=Rhodofomes roseus TaxID=34475 RepID=A0A4Y9YNC8_9APHY|nr:hypothetical protein EVJ58_g3404 [Rhodofomes roseus]
MSNPDDTGPSVWEELLRKDNLWVGHGSETAFADAILAQRRRQGLPQLGAQPLPHPYEILHTSRQLSRTRWAENQSPKHVSVPAHGRSVVTCLLISQGRVITASDDSTINIYSLPTGGLERSLKGHGGGVWSIVINRNTLVSGSTDRSIRVWDIESGRCTHTFGGHTSTVRALAIVRPELTDMEQDGDTTVSGKWPKHPLVVSGSRDHTLRVWALPKPGDTEFHSPMDEHGGEQNPYHKLLLDGHEHAVRALAARGRTAVSGSFDCTVRVWDIATGTCKWVLVGHTEKVYCVALDTRRQRTYSGSLDGTVRIWDLQTGQCLHVLTGHESLVSLVALSPSYLVSGCADSTLRVWDPDAGAHLHTLRGASPSRGAITCFAHDEFKVLAGSDSTLRMWDVRSGAEVRDLLTGAVGVWQVACGGRCEGDADWVGEPSDGVYD